MILLGVAYGAAAGRIEDVSNGFIEGGGEAVSLCITMLGIVSLWTGSNGNSQKERAHSRI